MDNVGIAKIARNYASLWHLVPQAGVVIWCVRDMLLLNSDVYVSLFPRWIPGHFVEKSGGEFRFGLEGDIRLAGDFHAEQFISGRVCRHWVQD